MALIVFGAAVGGPLRFVVDQKIRTYTAKPYGIFTVNILRSFLLGFTYGRVEEGFDLFAIGFAGAFTTWSTFMLDVNNGLAFRRRTALNILLTFGLCIAAVAAGAALAS